MANMIGFEATLSELMEVRWHVASVGNSRDEVAFGFPQAGKLSGNAIVELFQSKLATSQFDWLTVDGQVAKLDSASFKRWLFNSIYADRLTSLGWLNGLHRCSIEIKYYDAKFWQEGSTDQTYLKMSFDPKTQLSYVKARRSPNKIIAPVGDPIVEHRPQAIQSSLKRLQDDHANHAKIAFVMMAFARTNDHN